MEKIELRGWRGLRLAADRYGSASDPTVILMHGGGQTRHSWGATSQFLADAGFCAIALDMRGHGESEWDPEGCYSLDAFRNDLLEITEHLGGVDALVGASLGGLTAMTAIGESVRQISKALVLVDVTPRLNPTGVKQILDFMGAYGDGFVSLEAAVEAVAAYLPHRSAPSTAGLARNLRRHEDGRLRWHWDPKFYLEPSFALDSLEQRCSAAAARIKSPTILVYGARSEVVDEDSIAHMRVLIPHAETLGVSNARHMVAGDENDAFSAGVTNFLRGTIRPSHLAAAASPPN